MFFSEKEIADTEEKIKRYYRYLTVIEGLKHRLNVLEKIKTQLENDILNDEFYLAATVASPVLDKDYVQYSGRNVSTQETAMERAFSKMERKLVEIKEDIADVKMDILNYEKDICDIDFILNKLDETAAAFVKLHYGQRKGYVKIARSLHISTATIGRLRLKVLHDIHGYHLMQNKT